MADITECFDESIGWHRMHWWAYLWSLPDFPGRLLYFRSQNLESKFILLSSISLGLTGWSLLSCAQIGSDRSCRGRVFRAMTSQSSEKLNLQYYQPDRLTSLLVRVMWSTVDCNLFRWKFFANIWNCKEHNRKKIQWLYSVYYRDEFSQKFFSAK